MLRKEVSPVEYCIYFATSFSDERKAIWVAVNGESVQKPRAVGKLETSDILKRTRYTLTGSKEIDIRGGVNGKVYHALLHAASHHVLLDKISGGGQKQLTAGHRSQCWRRFHKLFEGKVYPSVCTGVCA